MLLVLWIIFHVAAGSQSPSRPKALTARDYEQLAQQSADSWLALVDAGNYAGSWQEAASVFKSAVSQDRWQSMLHPSRDPLGKVTSRKLKSAKYTKTMPGAPDGEYVILQYETSFDHRASAVETVTPMLDKDGKWRVSGYYIR